MKTTRVEQRTTKSIIHNRQGTRIKQTQNKKIIKRADTPSAHLNMLQAATIITETCQARNITQNMCHANINIMQSD